ncbi:MAG: DUF5615 family PIN-like protein [Deltaproteobacteria bacterium]|nr:DUF5615 family PIN-like protein [Deltaproteobacteria bacterium]
MKPRFLLDEHIPRAIQRQLRRQRPDLEVLAIGDPGAPPAGTSDPNILNWIEQNNYILVTENRSTIPTHLSNHLSSGRHIPGPFWVRPGVTIGRMIEELYLIWLVSSVEEFKDRTLFIPLD